MNSVGPAMIKSIEVKQKILIILSLDTNSASFEIAQSISYSKKNPAYGRQRISRPMRIVGSIQFGEVACFFRGKGSPNERPGSDLVT